MAEAYVSVRLYEAVYVVDPAFEEEQLNAVIGRFEELAKSKGAENIEIEKWEKRRLAYEVKGRREGFYVIMRFNSGPKVPAELERVFKLSDDVLRFIVVRPDEQ